MGERGPAFKELIGDIIFNGDACTAIRLHEEGEIPLDELNRILAEIKRREPHR